MKAVIIYNSKQGFTKKYANWLAKEIRADVKEFSTNIKVKDYETIIFASWMRAGFVDKIDWLKKQNTNDKKVIVLVTGVFHDNEKQQLENTPK